jgi:transcriptional regulator with XRE-family HTH domain
LKKGYGDFIRKHRLGSGYKSQRRLADKSGISAATISRIESEIQKPEVSTLQTLAQFLETTSYVELMVVCGYWDKDELLEEVQIKEISVPYDIETKKPSTTEEDFIESIDLSDEDLFEQFDLQIDNQSLSEDEAKGVIAYVRSLRQIQKSNQNK